MRKTISIITISLLFQSCFSYKAVENNFSQYEVGKHYKIQHDNKTKKVSIISKTDSFLVVNHKFQEEAIGIDSIEKVQRRKFSIVKTVLMPTGIVAVIVLLAGIALSY